MGSLSGQFKMALNSERLVTSTISPPGGRGVLDCLKQKLSNLGLLSLQGHLLYSSPGAPGGHLVNPTASGRHFNRLTYKFYGACWLCVASWRYFSGFIV